MSFNLLMKVTFKEEDLYEVETLDLRELFYKMDLNF